MNWTDSRTLWYGYRMSGKRCYGDACGIARALDTVGERWALMVVRELMLGPKRFTDLRAALPHVSPDVLTQRLRDLEEKGVTARRTLPPPAASKVYELTAAGRELEPVLVALGRWGGTYAAPPAEGMCMSFDSHILSMTTLFDPELAGDFEARVNLALDEGREFAAEVALGRFEIEHGAHPEPDATIRSSARTLIDVLHGRLELDDAIDAGELEIEGHELTATHFTSLFPIPEPIAASTPESAPA